MSNTFIQKSGGGVRVAKDDPASEDDSFTVTVTTVWSDGLHERTVVSQQANKTQAEIADSAFFTTIMTAATTAANT